MISSRPTHICYYTSPCPGFQGPCIWAGGEVRHQECAITIEKCTIRYGLWLRASGILYVSHGCHATEMQSRRLGSPRGRSLPIRDPEYTMSREGSGQATSPNHERERKNSASAGDISQSEDVCHWFKSMLGINMMRPATRSCMVRDLWARQDCGLFVDRFAAVLPPHGAGLYRVSPQG